MGISFHGGPPAGEPGRGSSTKDFERWMKEGSRNGGLLSEEAQCGVPLGRAPLLGISLHRCPFGEPGGDSLAETFERKG